LQEASAQKSQGETICIYQKVTTYIQGDYMPYNIFVLYIDTIFIIHTTYKIADGPFQLLSCIFLCTVVLGVLHVLFISSDAPMHSIHHAGLRGVIFHTTAKGKEQGAQANINEQQKLILASFHSS
jgi:hypothetical protein